MAAACAQQPAPGYDLVIANGRVMDPESGLDAVRHVGIRQVVVDRGEVTTARPGRAIRAPVKARSEGT